MSSDFRFLFHVMRNDLRVVVLQMDTLGRHELYLPKQQSSNQAWPHYAEIAPYLDVWLEQYVGQPIQTPRMNSTREPGDVDYPRTLAAALSSSLLGLWAYVTHRAIYVTSHQIALAVGVQARAKFRNDLAARGIQWFKQSNRWEASLAQVEHILGTKVAGQIQLLPWQIGRYLGISSQAAANLVRRLGIHSAHRETTVAAWAEVRTVVRIGQRSFEVRNG